MPKEKSLWVNQLGVTMFFKSIVKIIKTFSKKLSDDHVNAFSAQSAFFILISFFPFLMFLMTLLKYVPVDYEALNNVFIQAFPETVSSLLLGILDEIKNSTTGAVISASVAAALWTSSKGFLAIVRGMNGVYNHKETRNYFVLRFWSAVYTLIFAIMIIAILLIFVFGNRISQFFLLKVPLLAEFALLITSIRTITGLSVLILFFLFIYVVIPNRKSNVFSELPGAFISAAGWMGFSYLYSFYIDNMGRYSTTYGSLTAIVLCMLWLYSCMYIMFVGAEINAVFKNAAIKEAIRGLFLKRKKESGL